LKQALLFLAFFGALFADLELETLSDDFVLEVKRVEIPDFPYAFNASMVPWQGFILMSFRTIPNPKDVFTSWIGVILLDRAFNPVGEPQILQTRAKGSAAPPRAEDARLVYIGGRLHIVYSDNDEPELTGGGFRVVVGELAYRNGLFSIENARRLVEFEGEMKTLREKSWVPFDWMGSLLLSYTISPHLVFQPLQRTGVCHTLARSDPPLEWDWGVIRGGTPALLLENGEYLSFFHSVKKMATENSKGKTMSHYFIGAYTFSSTLPFQLTRLSPKPIVGSGFYTGASYKPYWGSIQCVFPAGLILDGNDLWISYGRQDHEIWVARLDKRRLMNTLKPIDRSKS